MGCKNARAVAHRFAHTTDDTPQGFTCATKVIAYEASKHRRHKGRGLDRKIVKFKTAA